MRTTTPADADLVLEKDGDFEKLLDGLRGLIA